MPPRVASSALRREAGSASIELIAVVPFLLLAILVAAQIGLAGQALWSAAVAARAGARAGLVGDRPGAVARAALPPSMRAGAEIEAEGGTSAEGVGERLGAQARSAGDVAAVSVRVPVPGVVPGLPAMSVGAAAGLPPMHGEGSGGR